MSKPKPFELLFPEPEEGITFCGVPIPKYGSLTPNEAIALAKLTFAEDTPLLLYYAEVGNILLRSRTKLKQYTVQELMDLPIPSAELAKLFDFAISENRQWKAPEPEEEAPEKKDVTGQESTGDSDWLIQTSDDSIPFALATPPL